RGWPVLAGTFIGSLSVYTFRMSGPWPAAVDWMTTLSIRAKLIDSTFTAYFDCDLLNPSTMLLSALERGSVPCVARNVQNVSSFGCACAAPAAIARAANATLIQLFHVERFMVSSSCEMCFALRLHG